MILDATAGNRSMWRHKNTPNIIYIDIEKKLERKPTIFADNTKTPFLSGIFDTIFYDPPHSWRQDLFWASFPTHEEYSKLYKPKKCVVAYYGWDKYKNQQELLVHLWRAQKEFHRILKDDGLLWLKWNVQNISIRRVLLLFEDWKELLRLYIKAPSQTAGKSQTYWICLMKEKKEFKQTTLL
jgi:hypothetical protein